MSPTAMRALSKPLLILAVIGLFSPWMLATSATSAVTPDPNMVRITADKQSYNMEKKNYTLTGRVTVAFHDIRISGNRAEMETDESGKPNVAHFFERPLFKRGNPKAAEDVIVGDTIKLYLNDDRFGAQGNVESVIATVAADPFLIRSDIQEFDNKNKVVSASGNVEVDYQKSKVFSELANVRMKDDGKAERVIFSGGARVKKTASEIAGDRITVMVDSGNLLAEHNVKTRVDLEARTVGNPPQVVITSDYQQYDQSSDMMIASGNVKILYGDYIATGPKATFKLKDNDLDRIVMTSRATIIDNGRTITADKIIITTNPKNFDAMGNVKVNFKKADRPAPAPAASAKPAAKGGKTSGGKAVPAGKPLPKDDPSDY